MGKYTFGFFMSLAFLGGCIKIPTDEARCLMETTPSLEETTETALKDMGFVEGDFPNPNWWEIFQDSQLSTLILQALNCNPTMARVQARVNAAEEEAKVKKSWLFPTIGFNASLDWEYLGKNDFFRAFTPVIPGNITEYEINLDFSYEIDFWGKNRNIYRAALGRAKAEMAERGSAILMLTTSVAAIYFKLQASMQELALLKKERGIITDLFRLTKQRLENALDTSSQQLSSEERLFIMNQNILLAKQKVVLYKHLLKMLIGNGPDGGCEVEKIAITPLSTFPLPKNLSSDLIARRPDLMAQIWRIEAAAHLVGAAKADFYPRVDLFALAGLDSVFFNKLFSLGSRTASLEPALHLPIFNAGRIKANLQIRKSQFEEMIYCYNEAVLNAVKEVADQIVILQTTSENLKIQDQVVQNRVANRKLMSLRYEHAISNLLDVLEQQDLVIREQFLKIKLQYKQEIAAVQLIKALGGGYCNCEVPFD